LRNWRGNAAERYVVSVSNPASGFEYSSRGLGGFFAERANLLRVNHYRLLLEILRFNREAPKLLSNPAAASMTLGCD